MFCSVRLSLIVLKCRLFGLCRAIEDNVLKTCADLVRNCVAVGHLKPRVVLLIESSTSTGAIGAQEAQALKEEVLCRTADYNGRLLEHERITDPSSILVVPAGTLPRTSVSVTAEGFVLSCADMRCDWALSVFIWDGSGKGKHPVSRTKIEAAKGSAKLTAFYDHVADVKRRMNSFHKSWPRYGESRDDVCPLVLFRWGPSRGRRRGVMSFACIVMSHAMRRACQ
jgi:hypothetical protein